MTRMLRIGRVIDSATVVLTVSGRIGAADVPTLRELIRGEGRVDLALDLAEIHLVDADAVRFLAECEAHGIRLIRCPAYVREWMLREHGESS